MAAPDAPVISRIKTNGLSDLYIYWAAVPTATDYKLYVGSSPNPTGLEDDIPDDDAQVDGNFRYILVNQAGVVYIRLTALNVGAEESAYSNEWQVNVRTSFKSESSSALEHHRKLC